MSTTDLLGGSMLTTMIVSLRLPSIGSSPRWSMPSRRMLSRLTPFQSGRSPRLLTGSSGSAGAGVAGHRRHHHAAQTHGVYGAGFEGRVPGICGREIVGPFGILICAACWRFASSRQLLKKSQPKEDPPGQTWRRRMRAGRFRALNPPRWLGCWATRPRSRQTAAALSGISPCAARGRWGGALYPTFRHHGRRVRGRNGFKSSRFRAAPPATRRPSHLAPS